MRFRTGKSILSVFQLISANVVVKAVGLVMVAFYTRYLTKEDLSLIPIYALVGSLSMVFFGLGLRPTVLRLLPSMLREDPVKARGVVFTASSLLFAGAGLFAILAVIFSPQLSSWLFQSQERTGLMRIIAVGSFFVSSREITNYLLWTASRFDRISVVQMVGAIGRAVLGASFVLIWGISGLAVALVLIDVICFVLSMFFLRDLLAPGPIRWYSAKRLIRDSIPFYLEGFMIYFRGKGDSWIIASALGPEAIATYFVAKRFPQMLTMMRGSIDNVMTTQISKKANQPEEIAAYIPRLYCLISHMMMPAILAIAGMTPFMIFVISGSEFSGAVVPGIFLCLVQLAHLYAAPVGRALFVTRKPIVRVLATTGEALFMMVCLFFLAPAFEEVGVAASLFLAGLMGYGLAFFLLRRGLDFRFPTGQFLKSMVASVSMVGVMLVLQYSGWPFWLAPVYALAGLSVFALLVSFTNSAAYYKTINSVAPIRIVDPVRWLLRRSPRADDTFQ